jgi:SAM-dependent methyltransferase
MGSHPLSTIDRRRLDGTRTIVRFNAPKYALVAALVVGAVLAAAVGLPVSVAAPLSLAAVFGLLWSVSSLVATWWVYDHIRIYDRVGAGLGPVGEWAVVHAGFDESEDVLAATVRRPPYAVVALATNARRGLRHARGEHVGTALDGSVRRLPLDAGSVDTLFLTLTVHEVRRIDEQRALFAELRRVLRPGGRLVITEHGRDLANAAVYGPAAWHFQPARTWRRRAGEQGFEIVADEPITPFVRRMVWRAASAVPAQTTSERASASSST